MSTDIQKALSISSELDKKSRDFLSKALASNGKQEFDYIKYRKALNAILAMGLDEATAFKSAFATAKTMGLTKTSLSNSAKSYLSVLMEEKSKFDEALANQVKTKVASKAEQVQKLETRIDEMRQKIAEMEKRMRAMLMLGVPYTEDDFAAAAASVAGKTEMDAMVAYLQVLGTMVPFGDPLDQGRFSATKVPKETDDLSSFKAFRQPYSEIFRFLRALGYEEL